MTISRKRNRIQAATTTTSTASHTKTATINREIHAREFKKDDAHIGSQSQITFLSSPDETQSQPVTDYQVSSSSSGFFSSSSNDAYDSSSDDDYSAHVIKRQRSDAIGIDPTMVAMKTAFMTVLEEFYQNPVAKIFNQRQLAAHLACWFAQALAKPNIQMLARATDFSQSRADNDAEREGYVTAFNLLKRSGFGTACVLVPGIAIRDVAADPTGPIIRVDSSVFKQEFEKFMRSNLKVYTLTKCPPNSEYSTTLANLTAKFKERPNLDYTYLARYHPGVLPDLHHLETFITSRIECKLPTNAFDDSKEFIKLFFETKFNRLTKIFKAKAAERAPKAVAHILQEIGKLILGDVRIKKELQALGKLFKEAGDAQLAQLEVSTNSSGSVNNGHLLRP
jgi:hypothetical protein